MGELDGAAQALLNLNLVVDDGNPWINLEASQHHSSKEEHRLHCGRVFLVFD